MRIVGLILLGLMALVFLLAPMAVFSDTLQDRIIDNSARYTHVRELTNRNDGPDVERILAFIGLPKGSSWCMAYVCYVVRHDSGFPWPKYGRCATTWAKAQAQEFTYTTFSANDVKMGIEKLQPADVPIWANGAINAKQDFNGHTGIVLKQLSKTSFLSREGNTTPGASGNQADGGGVYDRTRGLGFGSSFRVMGFIRIRGAATGDGCGKCHQ